MSDEQVLAIVQTALHFVGKDEEDPWPPEVLQVYRSNLKNARNQIAVTRSPDQEGRTP